MTSKAALLWDESYLWGVMSYDALRSAGLGFSLINAEDVREGRLSDFKAIFVPGGWASNKLKRLGPEGSEAIREFVSSGRAYVGLCGGAGMATSDGVGLIDIKRKPLARRVPSVSGPVRLNLSNHGIWEGTADDPLFNVWWPSQFVVEDDGLNVLASFGHATPQTFSSDFCVRDMDANKWREAEEAYGINLDPSGMEGDPLVVEGTFDEGKVLVSLVHFDTPGSASGATVLKNIWDYLGLEEVAYPELKRANSGGKLYESAQDIFTFGERNFLWFRNGSMTQWRRGVRGLEYFTLYRLAEEIAVRLGDVEVDSALGHKIEEFSEKAIRLLGLEGRALRMGQRLTFAETEDPEITSLRKELFSTSKSYGGPFKELLDQMDALLYQLLLKEMAPQKS